MSTASNTTLTSPGSTNTKGAWTQLSSSLPFDVSGILINHQDTGGSVNGSQLYDLGVGSSGNEWAIIENIYNQNYDVSSSDGLGNFGAKFWPINLRAGARLSARQQVNSLSAKSAQLSVTLFPAFPGGLQGGSRIVALGAVTASTSGTVVGPASSTAWGSWVELSASCPAEVVAIMPYVFSQQGATADYVYTATDIALGGSGSEFAIVERLLTAMDDGNNKATCGTNIALCGWLPCNIPEGARVSARMKHMRSDVNTAHQMILYGLVA
jgi:hypothetical protein